VLDQNRLIGPNQPVKDGPRRSYIRELDGLRAIAILGVLLFHLHFPGFSLAWAGVPLFFVISGFLITRILLGSYDKPFYFRNFYVRRSLRIFPIYYLILFLYFVILAVAPQHSKIYGIFAGTGGGKPFELLPYYLTYTQTIPQIHSYYRDLPMLGHTWSLACEEQFYWVWPFVVLAARRERLFIVLVLLFLLGPITRAVIMTHTTNPHYITGILPDQLDQLTMGALIAWMVDRGWDKARVLKFGWTSAVLGAAIVTYLFVRSSYPAWWKVDLWVWQPQNIFMYTGLGLLCGGIVALCVAESRSMQWLKSPLLVNVGKVSYGMYLYHVFVLFAVSAVIGKIHRNITEAMSPWRMLVIICCIGTSYGVALVSWKLIEFPINSLKDRFTRRGLRDRSS
jgi:peptidoglycan/LPS O-acetylase OafA/YrhL